MITRTFGVPDADMFESGRTMRQLFIDHKAAFVAKDANVDDPFAANWLASIEDSEGWETGDTRRDQQELETADVTEQMARGRKKWNEMKYYIERAFGSKPALIKKFGSDNYENAAGNQPRMATFLKNLHTQSEVTANKTELLAQGCTQPQIDEIATIHDSLIDENTEQNAFIGESPEASDARIKQYNDSYGYAQQINRLSKVVYYGDTTMLNMFHLPEGPQPDPDINVKGKVIDSANGNALKDVVVKVVELEIVDNTSFYGNFSFVSIPAGNYTLLYSLPGYVPVTQPITVLATGVITANATLIVG